MVDSDGVAQAQRDLGRSLAAYRRAAGYTQHGLAHLVQYGRSTIANVETGRQNVSRDFWVRCDTALGFGGKLAQGHAALEELRQRHLRDVAAAGTARCLTASNIGASTPGLRRRDLLDLAGGALLAVTIDAQSRRVADIAAALTTYEGLTSHRHAEAALPSLDAATAGIKRLYQAGRHAEALQALPGLLRRTREAPSGTTDIHRSRAEVLVAAVYQVAGSVLLKFGETNLAMVAADRCMAAAQRSDDPITVAAACRLLTHALMSSGHLGRAADVAESGVQRFDSAVAKPTEDGLAVRGALLLRGAIASARQEDRVKAQRMLDEASVTAAQIGPDGNLRWTAFGPTNVLLHRLSVSVALGNAGEAIDHARRVRIDWIPLGERRACLFIDVAQAFAQWGKYERAYEALRKAEATAPEELRVRRTVHQLVADLTRLAPSRLRPPMREMAARIGVAA